MRFVKNLGKGREPRRPRRRWEDNIRMDLREIGWEVVDWIHLAQDSGPMAGCCEHGSECSGSIEGSEFPD
jgi:hypothetical protein